MEGGAAKVVQDLGTTQTYAFKSAFNSKKMEIEATSSIICKRGHKYGQCSTIHERVSRKVFNNEKA